MLFSDDVIGTISCNFSPAQFTVAVSRCLEMVIAQLYADQNDATMREDLEAAMRMYAKSLRVPEKTLLQLEDAILAACILESSRADLP